MTRILSFHSTCNFAFLHLLCANLLNVDFGHNLIVVGMGALVDNAVHIQVQVIWGE